MRELLYLRSGLLDGVHASDELGMGYVVHPIRSNISMRELLYLRSELLDGVHASDKLGMG
jgi:hypothetical protein